jgi:hypothetical protein
VREDLDELGAGRGPVVQQFARAQAAGPAVVVLDQLLEQRLVGHLAVQTHLGAGLLFLRQQFFQRHHAGVAAAAKWPSSS